MARHHRLVLKICLIVATLTATAQRQSRSRGRTDLVVRLNAGLHAECREISYLADALLRSIYSCSVVTVQAMW